MSSAIVAPVDHSITMDQLTTDPYPIYRRLRAESPVLTVSAIGRTLLTKAVDTQYVKKNPELFSSDDPNTPMERTFHAKTLMRRDGEDHMRLRSAMMPALSPAKVKQVWTERIEQIADEYIDRLPRGEEIDFYQAFAGPFSARCVAVVLGIPNASDTDIQDWSQALIDGAGNFGEKPELFERSDQANEKMNACIAAAEEVARDKDNVSALGVQINCEGPIEMEHIVSNIKIAIGGGINEPRDAVLTALYGLLTNRDQLEAAQADIGIQGGFLILIKVQKPSLSHFFSSIQRHGPTEETVCNPMQTVSGYIHTYSEPIPASLPSTNDVSLNLNFSSHHTNRVTNKN